VGKKEAQEIEISLPSPQQRCSKRVQIGGEEIQEEEQEGDGVK
jgi:hypothetical protein